MLKTFSMAITFKVFLDGRRITQSNLYPLKIRVTIDRQHREFNLDIRVEKRFWDHKLQKIIPSHPNYQLIQLKISKKLAELQENSLHNENQGLAFSVGDISSSLLHRQKNITFLTFSREQIKQLIEAGRIGNSIAYSCAVNKVEKYINTKDIRFEDINYRFLEEFTAWMRQINYLERSK